MNAAYVIVGASLAGAKAAQTLREEGFGGPVVLIGEERERPYERPRCPRTTCWARPSERRSTSIRPGGTPNMTSTCAWAPPSPASAPPPAR
jgi:NADPH-dependent 2,4-dienoyl-CoA reductase/sulfur reductase-like enzyme